MIELLPSQRRTASAAACSLALLVTAGGCGGRGDGNGPAAAMPAPEAAATLPGSLGADGWASVAADGSRYTVTGGQGADAAHTFHVRTRRQLIEALYGPGGDPRTATPDNTPKLIYVHGTVDLGSDDTGRPLAAEDYMRSCPTAYDSFARFDADYKAAYQPDRWLRQSLDSDNRPPALPLADADGRPTLEAQRACFAAAQARQVVLQVGANTSLLGVGRDARIVHGNLRLGELATAGSDAEGRPVLAVHRPVHNIVVRNIGFEDAYDFFPAWDPKDSFSIAAADFGVGLCSKTYEAATDQGPHQCPSRKGGRWNAEYDLLSVINASQVWIDHNSFSDGDRPDRLDPPVPHWPAPFNEREQKVQHHDGALDITLLGTRVTVSYNHFHHHDKTQLLGGSDSTVRYSDGQREVASYGPGSLAVTLHHNRYQHTVQRQPRVRFGRVHVYNNHYSGQLKPDDASLPVPDYAWSVAWTLSTAAKLYVENNVLEILPGSEGQALPGAAKLSFGDSLSSSLANRGKCVAAGFRDADCDTYFHESGTLLNGSEVAAGSLLAAAQARGTGNNAPVRVLDAGYWVPASSYAYTAQPAAAVAAEVLARAGAGKL
ncbi:pectate lyase [Eleftheria terrae]|uniref:pectate lyase family protein n=1 Tax=Eleftheria terrae TaxID=1597781 RepID=UPI00263B5716|nr:pectate lyase [Eleftheria terrae]WKB51755.1 pectate lyase [Eleftheria terrae]